MQEQIAPVCTAIDIGSNTLRVVVARYSPTGLEIIETDEALVRIGESVNATGAISAEKQEHTLAVLRRFKLLADKHAAYPILAIATEAIRKATNQGDFLQVIKQETGIEVHCIGGDVEATLTFYGATYEASRDPHPPALVGVMDMGGGSTELVCAKKMYISWHTSLPIGSGWLHDRFMVRNPPTSDDRSVARLFLRTYLSGLNIKAFPPLLFVTGGSANTLLLLAQRAFGLETDCSVLTRDDLVRCEGLLWSLSAEEVAERYQFDIKRARILSAGVLILLAILEVFRLDEIHVSTYGIREGLALAYARDGAQWLERAQQRAQASKHVSQDLIVAKDNSSTPTYHDDFATAGCMMFSERAKVMLNWREAVLKHEDIEAVHKMRVASRRLRAVMDAYQSICEPKSFKKAYRQVKDIADVLGIARDTDVMIENLQGQTKRVPAAERAGIEWLIEQLAVYRQQHQKKLEKFLQTLDDEAFLQAIAVCLPERGTNNGES